MGDFGEFPDTGQWWDPFKRPYDLKRIRIRVEVRQSLFLLGLRGIHIKKRAIRVRKNRAS